MSPSSRAVAVGGLCLALAACGLRPDSDVEPASLPPLPREAVPSAPPPTAPPSARAPASGAPDRPSAVATTAPAPAAPAPPVRVVTDLGARPVTLEVPGQWPEITLRRERGEPLEVLLADVAPPLRDVVDDTYGQVLSLTAQQLAGTQPLRLRVLPGLSSYAAFQACARAGGPCVEVV